MNTIQKLIDSLYDNSPLLFLINPPYATSSNNMGSENAGKGINSCSTKTSREMLSENLSQASRNLFAQFLYNITRIKKRYNKNVSICLFCNPIYLTGSTYYEFRKYFLSEFKFDSGMLFNASYFSDVANNWGINFSIWKSGENKDNHNFTHSLVEVKNNQIVEVGQTVIYNADDMKTAKDWIKEPIIGIKEEKVQLPTLTTGITVKENSTSNTTVFKSSLGCYFNVGNDVYQSTKRVSIFTGCDNSNANGLSIMPENFERICAMFSVRKLIDKKYYNNFSNFLYPNNISDEFYNDSIIFSLFHSSSNQTSLHQVSFNDKLWDIKNEFFFISRNEIMNLTKELGYDFTYSDAYNSDDRFVYKKLQSIHLSKEAQDVLEYAIKLTKESFKYRKEYDINHSEYQIMNWDCGWYQIKALVKEYMPDEYKEFQEKFRKLSDKMCPMVYKFGFLK